MEKNDVWLVVFLIMFSVVVAIALTSIRHSVTLSEEDHAKRARAPEECGVVLGILEKSYVGAKQK